MTCSNIRSMMIVAGFLTLAAPLAACAPEPVASAADIQAALDNPLRGTARSQDERRKPAELIALADVGPGDKVLDLIPGNGYWTKIFTQLVGPTGRVYAVWPQAYGQFDVPDVQAFTAMSGKPPFENLVTQLQPTTELTAPEPLDVVWTSQNYHDYADDFMGRPGPVTLARAAYGLLKPGGVFIVIDHASRPGRGMADTETLHRIDPAIVREQAESVGFIFAGESRVRINPADSATLPVFDPEVRGQTSQFAYKFRKPTRWESLIKRFNPDR